MPRTKKTTSSNGKNSRRGKYIGGSTGSWSPERRAKFMETVNRKKAEAALKLARLPEPADANTNTNNPTNRKLELVNRILDAPDNVLDTIEKVLKVA